MRISRGEAEIYGRTSGSRRPTTKWATLRQYEYGGLQYESVFQIRVISDENGYSVVELSGELDLVSMDRFERVVAEVLSGSPKEVMFDLTRAQFISAQGYAAIGRWSLGVPVTVRSRTDLTSRIMAIYGYDRVSIVIAKNPPTEATC